VWWLNLDAPAYEVFRLTLEVAVWTAFGAAVFAVIPIGPIAGLLGWLLYRQGVVAPLVYAGVGAFAAASGVALVLAAGVFSSRYPVSIAESDIDASAYLSAVAVVVVGAFAGFMAGRKIRRDAAAR
jgi:hypothetical protein